LQAAAAAAELAARFAAQVTLLTVVQPPEGMGPYVSEAIVEELRRGVQQASEAMLEQASARVRPVHLEVESRVVWGTPAASIAAEADSGYDLIVMGSRGMGMVPADRGLLGSVTERVLRRTRCPVLVIPAPGEEQPSP
jgi:nucleotide-binding universal stress UspA family protein